MPTQVQFRRGTTAQNAGFTGANGEISIDTSKKTVIVHDGATPGGFPLAPNTAFDVANGAFSAANNANLGPAFDVANAAFGVANGSFAKANGALANTTNTVFQGNLTITGALTVGMNTTIINETSIIAQSLYIGNSTSYVAVSSGTTTNAAFDVANAAFGKANAANVLAYDTGIGANAFATTVGTSANNYAGAMANSSNAYSNNTFLKLTGGQITRTNTMSVSTNLGDINGLTVSTQVYSSNDNITVIYDDIIGIQSLAISRLIGTNSSLVYSNNIYGIHTTGGVLGGSLIANGSLITQNVYGIYTTAGTARLVGTGVSQANNAYGIFIDNGYVENGGNTINAYGLYVANTNHGDSKNYSIYVAGGESYFGGSINVGGSDLLTSLISANNYAGLMANASNTYAASLTPNLAPPFDVANAAFAKANSANVLAYDTGIGANAYAGTVGTSSNNYAGVMANSVNAYTTATYYSKSGGTISGAVTINGDLIVQGNSYQYSSNTLVISDPLLYLAANNYTSDAVDIGFIANYVNATSQNVHTGIFRDAGSKEWFVFQGYDKEPENNHIDPAGNNFAIAVLNADLRTSNLNLGGANAITWITSAYDKANSANVLAYNTGIGANAFATSVGTAGNSYAVVVGTSGNAYAVAVGAAGNVYAQSVGTSGNNYAATVGTSSNNYAGVMANSVNAYTSATYSTLTQFGSVFGVSNAAFGVANGAFGAANGKVASVTGTAGQIYSSGGTTPTVNLISSGVTAATYGGTTAIPVIVVDAYGRITSAANSGISAGDPTAAYNTANAAFGVANGAFAKANAAATAASPTITGTINMQAAIANYTLTDGVNIDWNLNTGQVATVTLGGNRTMNAPTNLRVGTFILHVIQDATGSRTITWNSVFKWPAAVAPTLTTTGSRRDIISFVCDGTNLYGSFLPDVR